MAKKLILHGRVQGVFCRAYCSQYGRALRVRGAASNLQDGTVRVLLQTDDAELVKQYVANIKSNPQGFTFYGKIDSVDVADYSGAVSGDYQF